MATINQKLQAIKNSKDAIKNALMAKGVDMEGVAFNGYAEKIASISTGKSVVTSFEGTKVFANLTDAEELNSYCVVGALLSYKEGTGFTVWNGSENMSNRAWNWKADASTHATFSSGNLAGWKDTEIIENSYGTVIAVCVGEGLWVATEWDSTVSKMWAALGSHMYNSMCPEALHTTNGAEVARHFYDTTKHDLTNSIFADIKAFRPTGSFDVRCYLPSRFELINMWYNICSEEHQEKQGETVNHVFTNNLGWLVKFSTSYYYWSSSQYGDGYYNAYYMNGYGGNMGSYIKDNYDRSFAFLHFGAALAA